jgi:hypothetical protein
MGMKVTFEGTPEEIKKLLNAKTPQHSRKVLRRKWKHVIPEAMQGTLSGHVAYIEKLLRIKSVRDVDE